MTKFNRAQRVANFGDRLRGVRLGHQVVERSTVETDGGALIDRREPQRGERRRQRTPARPQVNLPLEELDELDELEELEELDELDELEELEELDELDEEPPVSAKY